MHDACNRAPPGQACRGGDTYDEGEALFQIVCDHGMEGVMATCLSSLYVPASAAG